MILLALGLALVVCGGLAALLLRRAPQQADRAFSALVTAGCLLALVPAAAQLFDPAAAAAWIGTRSPGGATAFGIDALSAWFLLLVLGAGAATTVYGVRYLRVGHETASRAAPHLQVALLVASLAGVVTARTLVGFLVAWEVMAIASYLLIMFEHEKPQVRRAGFLYIVLTHTCTLGLLCMFAVWSGGRLDVRFDELPAASAAAAVAAPTVLALALVSFGIKAGMVPFHFWLPDAHSAAPSHVSALMSGVVIKMGIYGLLRVLAHIGPPPAWWGWTVLALGVLSAVLGVLWALAQHDIKRLLAYHSVENIGIILMGLGLGSLGVAYHQPAVAVLGYAGALLHTLNHSLFKSLLFLGAGAMGLASGTREIDHMGGLSRRLPRTALAFLVGSVAIVGLPPLNGFVSEWLVFRGMLVSGTAADGLRLACVGAVGLALTGALALACFSKLYGVAFLGTSRAPAQAPQDEGERGLAAPQLALAAACVLIGLAPGLLLPALMRATALLLPPGMLAGVAPLTLDGAAGISGVAAGLVVLAALLALGRALALRGRAVTAAPTWGCAYPRPTSRMQTTASSYAAPLLSAFGPVSGSRVERTAGALRTRPRDLVLDLLGRPLWQRMTRSAADIRILHSGAIRWYLLYTIVCLLGLLVYLRGMATR